ncbi:p-selectin [Trichonephila clavipes]|nr:p-selectin [Trichonephila clavipes]
MPKCIPKICPPPYIPEYLEIKGNCTFKKIGEHCEVSCKHGGKVIGTSNGRNTIRCLENLKWSSPLDCTCANPNVFDPVQLITKCDSIPKMGKCFLRCKKGYNIAGINYTTCQTNRKWGAFPTCRKISCPEPDLSSSILKVNGECSGKFYQDACFVTCREGGQLIGEAKIKCEDTGGINYTTCQTNRKWGAFPTCRKISCPEPDLSSSILKVNGECSGKFYQDACFVTCREGGQLIGEAKIKCEDTGVWSSLPLCTCPVPNSSGDLILKNCKAKRPDEHCFVECKTHLKLIGDAFFMCQKIRNGASCPNVSPRYVHPHIFLNT